MTLCCDPIVIRLNIFKTYHCVLVWFDVVAVNASFDLNHTCNEVGKIDYQFGGFKIFSGKIFQFV